jgi:uncharacterized membrane protein
MTAKPPQAQDEPGNFHAVLMPHRSLSPQGFTLLMALVGAVSFVAGMVFLVAGAWPVFGFFGLDVLLIYLAFKLNYRSGRAYETVAITPEVFRLTRVDPTGREKHVELNPYWARVSLRERPDGRTFLSVVADGREIVVGRFLTDDERRDFATALREALLEARGGVRI